MKQQPYLHISSGRQVLPLIYCKCIEMFLSRKSYLLQSILAALKTEKICVHLAATEETEERKTGNKRV